MGGVIGAVWDIHHGMYGDHHGTLWHRNALFLPVGVKSSRFECSFVPAQLCHMLVTVMGFMAVLFVAVMP